MTGVQTCALPISFELFSAKSFHATRDAFRDDVRVEIDILNLLYLYLWVFEVELFFEFLGEFLDVATCSSDDEIGRASCRERV